MDNIPVFLYDLLLKQYGNTTSDSIIKGFVSERDVTLRVNTLKSNVDEIEANLTNSNIEFDKVNWYKDALVIKDVKEEKIRKLDIYNDGKIYLQNLSSMLPPIILDPKQGDNILDMAAAPGGKTTQIAAITNNKSFITACEKNRIRSERLKYNLQKQGVGCVNVMNEDARNLSDFFSFDKILLDSPCSGSGTDNVFSKNFNEDLIKRSSKFQEQLLIKALKILKPGGEIVYSTCSILKQENEEIIGKILKNLDCEIIPIDLDNSIPKLPVNIRGTVCVCPDKNYEGFFVAKLRKK